MAKQGLEYLQSSTKDCLDPLVAIAASTLVVPTLVIVAPAAAIDTKSTPFFRQQRIDYGNRESREYTTFEMIKVQTIDPRKVMENPGVGGIWDDRASKFGNFLRVTSLDEFPQLIAPVISGRMAISGLRAMEDEGLERFRDADHSLFDKYWYPIYEVTKKGLISPGSVFRKTVVGHPNPLAEVMRLDVEWALNEASLLNDLKIYGISPFTLARYARSPKEYIAPEPLQESETPDVAPLLAPEAMSIKPISIPELAEFRPREPIFIPELAEAISIKPISIPELAEALG